MTPESLIDSLRHMLWVSMLLALPSLGVALIIGLGIGLVQAVTSIQEQTLSFVPKLIGIVLVFVLLGGWMTQVLVSYTGELFAALPRYGGI
jgi:flagellar biosynthesis protein FliQ